MNLDSLQLFWLRGVLPKSWTLGYDEELDVGWIMIHDSWIMALCSARWVSSQVFVAGPLRRLLNSFCLGSYLYWEDSFFRDVLFLKKLHFPRSHIPGKLHFPASLISPLSNFSRCNFSQDVNFLWKSCFFGKYNSLGSHISQEVTFSGKSLVSQSLGNIIW